MLNYNKNDTEKSLKLQKIFNERWKKQGGNYRTDNDIFNIRENKNIQDGRFYKKTAQEISESRLDSKFKDKSPFFYGRRNEDYTSHTYRSQVFGDNIQNEKRNVLASSRSTATLKNNGSVKELLSHDDVNTQKLEKAQEKIIKITELGRNKSVGNYRGNYNTIENPSNNFIRRDKSCESVGYQSNNEDFSPNMRVTTQHLERSRSVVLNSIPNDERREKEEQEEKIDKSEVRKLYSRSVCEEVENSQNKNTQNNHPAVNESMDAKICYNCFNHEVGEIKVKDKRDLKLHRKFSQSGNKTEKTELNNSTLHDELEKYKEQLIVNRIKKRQELSSIASKSYLDSVKSDKNLLEKNKLQNKNQNEQFFFYKDNRDSKMELAKTTYEKKQQVIEDLVSKKVYTNDLKPGITNYYQKVVNNKEYETLPQNSEHIYTQTTTNVPSSHRPTNEEYMRDLQQQITIKVERKKGERQKEKEFMNEVFKSVQEKESLENEEKNANLKTLKNNFIRGNSELLEHKKKVNAVEKEKKMIEVDKERKIREIYLREMNEIKQRNDKYKKLMLNILNKQVEEKKKKEIEVKEEKKNIKYIDKFAIHQPDWMKPVQHQSCTSCHKNYDSRMFETKKKLFPNSNTNLKHKNLK